MTRLEEQLAAAKAEVVRLETEIAERDLPVGSIVRFADGSFGIHLSSIRSAYADNHRPESHKPVWIDLFPDLSGGSAESLPKLLERRTAWRNTTDYVVVHRGE